MLALFPLCRNCTLAAAEEVDHIVSATEDRPELWFDQGNLQTLCKACHRAKTAAQSGSARRSDQG
jgi:5-methylcytosine-specific restriction endonuclease McrA